MSLLHALAPNWLITDDGRHPERLRLFLCGRSLDHWSGRLLAELQGDSEVRALVDELFVPVVVDVDREPALARRAQQVLALTADAAGWPCVLCALPDGRPFGASPWRPLRDSGPTPGLVRLLVEIATLWQDDPEACRADAAHLAEALAQVPAPAKLPGRELFLDGLEAQAMAVADTLEGGFGPLPRLPQPTLLRFLWQRCQRDDAPLALQQQVERSFAALLAGGIHDHLAGGFHRACADAAWREPFFEKRARDNAQLASLFLAAAPRLGEAYRSAALRALAWVLADLRRDDGLIAHGLAADSSAAPGRWEAGAAYTWQVDQIADVVGEQGARILAHRFDLDERPRALAVRGQLSTSDAERLPELVARLTAARRERPAPRRDDTVYARDQGMMLVALAAAQAAESHGPWAAAAEGIRHALAGALWRHPADAAWVRLGFRAWNWPLDGLPEVAGLDDPLDDEDGPSPAALAFTGSNAWANARTSSPCAPRLWPVPASPQCGSGDPRTGVPYAAVYALAVHCPQDRICLTLSSNQPPRRSKATGLASVLCPGLS